MGTKTLRTARYWCSNGHGIAIVASITYPVDWAAYIGADQGYSELNCVKGAVKEGDKLLEQDARHFFPGIELPYRI